MCFAWCPDGTGEVNQAGIDHYNKVVIDALLAKGELLYTKDQNIVDQCWSFIENNCWIQISYELTNNVN